ncbi:MAG TPA: ABC transporter permease [Chloroflexota bacterium]|nr:ABC transporter permease [Chloroflexota bacterium]
MARSITRTLSFFSQWAAEVLRQPSLMVVLVLGPFLILFLFGYGENVGAPRPKTIIVTQQGQAQTPLDVNSTELAQFLDIRATTSNEQQARAALQAGQVDLLVVVPPDPSNAIQSGQHAQVQVLTNEIDPVRLSYAQAYIQQQVDALNRQTVQKAVAQAQSQIGDVHGFVAQAQDYLKLLQSAPDLNQSQADLKQLASSLDQLSSTLHQALTIAQNSPLVLFDGVVGQPISQLQQAAKSVDDLRSQVSQLQSQLTGAGAPTSLSPQDLQQVAAGLTSLDTTVTQLKTIPADVIAAPFSLDLRNIAPWKPNGTGFYAPALLALIIQHLGVTLGALSMSRVRLLGLMELFQTSPVKPVEVAIGNLLSYGTLCLVAGGALVGLIVGVLGVPVFGPPAGLAAAILLLTAAAVGIGLVVSMVSSSEQQAAQFAMLILIASVFFSGFLVSLDTISWPVRIVSYLLPATYAIRTLDDVMLRGILRTPFDLGILAAFAVVFFTASVLLFRREFKAR